jgi:tetratricopeptide (TPR) repeat protein
MSGQQEQRKRRRAVRLTSEGLDHLSDRLADVSASEALALSWEEKARLLDVSIVTARRILLRKGVDRSSLVAAFAALDLEWRDSYCESLSPVEQETPAAAQPIENVKSARSRAGFWVFLIPSVAAATLIGVRLTVPKNQGEDRLDYLTRRATEEYNSCRYEKANEDIEEAEKIARLAEDAPRLASAEIIHGQILTVVGDLGTSRSCYLEAISLRRAMHETRSLPPLYENLGLVEAEGGLSTLAREHFELALRGYSESKDPVGEALILRDLGGLALKLSDTNRADAFLSQALRRVSGQSKPDIETDILAQIALVRRDQHRFSEARSLLRQALLYWQDRHHARWVATTMFQMGTVEFSAGNPVAGFKLLRTSRSTYGQVGDLPGVRECDAWLSKPHPPAGARERAN